MRTLPDIRNDLNTNLEEIVSRFALRERFSEEVAQKKAAEDLPIHHPQREAEVLAYAEFLATKYKVESDHLREIVALLIVHSKEIQCRFLGREVIFDTQRPSDAELRNNLFQLTKTTATAYLDNYCGGRHANALQFARDIEMKELETTIRSLDKHGVALDLGCAIGTATEHLASAFNRIRAFDVSEDMIRAAKLRMPWGSQVVFEEADLFNEIPASDSSASLVVADFGAASEVSNNIFVETARVLCPRGKALLSFYNRESLDTKSYYPSTVALRSHVNTFNNTVEVWYDGNCYIVHAEAITDTDIRLRAKQAGLKVEKLLSYPTVLSVLSSYQCDRQHRTGLAEGVSRIDERLLLEVPMQGHYLLAVLSK